MGQGNDRGTQYRSGFYWYDDEQKALIEASRDAYQKALQAAGKGREITTEVRRGRAVGGGLAVPGLAGGVGRGLEPKGASRSRRRGVPWAAAYCAGVGRCGLHVRSRAMCARFLQMAAAADYEQYGGLWYYAESYHQQCAAREWGVPNLRLQTWGC